MRPVDKKKNDKEYDPYQTAKRDLFDAIGPYCSYCERRIVVSGAVEHVMPKSLHDDMKTKWCNLLLSCTNCNSCKGQKDINTGNITDYVWPDTDNTYSLVDYDPVTCMPKAADGLSEEEKKRVCNLISLVGLDKPEPAVGTKAYEEARDTRVNERLEAKEYAELSKAYFCALEDKCKTGFIKSLLSQKAAGAYGCISLRTCLNLNA